MDPTAVWTALGVIVAAVISVAGLIIGLQRADLARLRRDNEALRASNTDYLLRLTNSSRDCHDAEKRANEAEQLVANLERLGGRYHRAKPPARPAGEEP